MAKKNGPSPDPNSIRGQARAAGVPYGTYYSWVKKGVVPWGDELARRETGVAERVAEVIRDDKQVRRGWSTAITDTFQGSWSTISKKKAEFEAELGYEIPSYFEKGSDAELRFLLDMQMLLRPKEAAAERTPSQRMKDDAYKAKLRKEMELVFDARVHERARSYLEETLLAQLMRFHREAKSWYAARKGVFTKTEFNLLLKVFHPDANLSPEKLNEAFRLVNERRELLVKPDDVLEPIDWAKAKAEALARRRRRE